LLAPLDRIAAALVALTRSALLAANVEQANGQPLRAPRMPRADRAALDLRAVERRLGIHRSTLAAHLRAGTIHGVPFGKRTRVSADELERVLREGLPDLQTVQRRARRPAKCRRAQTGEELAAAILALKV
jgi:hypothetical protein